MLYKGDATSGQDVSTAPAREETRSRTRMCSGERKFLFVHPIWRLAVVRVETVFVLPSDGRGLDILWSALNGFPREASVNL
jgi:hypothetical protein